MNPTAVEMFAVPAAPTHLLSNDFPATQTPAEHRQIALYYEAKAQDYQARANVHQAMVEQYKADTTRVNNKNYASTIGHCEYFAQTLREQAAKAQEQAKLHQQMATEAAATN
jgi:hypothetical protein